MSLQYQSIIPISFLIDQLAINSKNPFNKASMVEIVRKVKVLGLILGRKKIKSFFSSLIGSVV